MEISVRLERAVCVRVRVCVHVLCVHVLVMQLHVCGVLRVLLGTWA